MVENWKALTVIPLAALFVAALLFLAHRTPVEQPEVPDFGSIKDVAKKKESFFSYMLPFVRASNAEIREERTRLLAIVASLEASEPVSDGDQAFMVELANKYRVTDQDPFADASLALLRRRVDTIPAALTLAQAANESAWGTSRFAREGNNYFGIWCWTKDCGMVPRRRSQGANHEVAVFDSPAESVRRYMLALNSNPAYKSLRDMRAEFRRQQKAITGNRIAEGLLSYSARGKAYIEELQAMIRINELRRFNRPAEQPSD